VTIFQASPSYPVVVALVIQEITIASRVFYSLPMFKRCLLSAYLPQGGAAPLVLASTMKRGGCVMA